MQTPSTVTSKEPSPEPQRQRPSKPPAPEAATEAESHQQPPPEKADKAIVAPHDPATAENSDNEGPFDMEEVKWSSGHKIQQDKFYTNPETVYSSVNV